MTWLLSFFEKMNYFLLVVKMRAPTKIQQQKSIHKDFHHILSDKRKYLNCCMYDLLDMCSGRLHVLHLPGWSGRAHNRNTIKEWTHQKIPCASRARPFLVSLAGALPPPSPALTPSHPLSAAAWMNRYGSHWKPCEMPTEYMPFQRISEFLLNL